MKGLHAVRPAWALLALAAATTSTTQGQEGGAAPSVQVEVEATTDDVVLASGFGGHAGTTPITKSIPAPQYPYDTPSKYFPAAPQVAPTTQAPPTTQAVAVPQIAVPQTAPVMMVPQMTATAASLVQVPTQNVVIQQPELRVFMAQSAPAAAFAAQPMAAQPAASANIFLPRSAAPSVGLAAVPLSAPAQAMAAQPLTVPAMSLAAVPMAAPPQAVAAVPMAAPAQAVAAVPMAAPTQAVAAAPVASAIPFAGGTITNQAVALASGESSSRFEIEAPSRFRNRLADILERASTRVRGRVRMRSVQETELRSPQGQVGGGGLMNISHSFAAPSIAQTTIPIPAQAQLAPPSPPAHPAPPWQPICPTPPPLPSYPPSKRPPVVPKAPPVPHKHF